MNGSGCQEIRSSTERAESFKVNFYFNQTFINYTAQQMTSTEPKFHKMLNCLLDIYRKKKRLNKVRRK